MQELNFAPKRRHLFAGGTHSRAALSRVNTVMESPSLKNKMIQELNARTQKHEKSSKPMILAKKYLFIKYIAASLNVIQTTVETLRSFN